MSNHLRLPLLFCSLFIAITATAGDGQVPRVVSVNGEGRITAVPDQATVMTGVETRADTPAAALAQNSASANALMKVLQQHGVAERDIQTSGFNLSPQYQYPRDGNGEPSLLGYTVSNQLSIRVRDLVQLGALLDALVQAGSNRMSGIEFSHSKQDEITNQARAAAIKDARQRAELYAQAAGVAVGAVLSIRDQGISAPQPMYRMAVSEAMVGGAPPVAAGEQQVQAFVQVPFELLQQSR
jgi:uncharacterized protein YggE